MKKNEISEIIGNINNKYVDEAIFYTGKENKSRHNGLMKLGTIAACLCIALVGSFAIPKLNSSISDNTKHADIENKSASHDSESNGYAPGLNSPTPNNKEDSEQNSAAQDEIDTSDNESNGHTPGLNSPTPNNKEDSEQNSAAQDEIDTSPVYYSNLMLPDKELNEDFPSYSESSMMDIVSFDESMLSDDCCMIIEGTVKDVYVKHYTYDIYSDKFEENGILHGKTDTIVYEVEVDKTWYGEDISGETILIEDNSHVTEPIFAVKEGGRYVLPLYESGETIWTLGHEYAGGDITRETPYSTLYVFHPQIEATNDGSYIVSQDWTTLTANAREIIMDTLDAESFWKDKMYLVDKKTFEDQMTILLSNLS